MRRCRMCRKSWKWGSPARCARGTTWPCSPSVAWWVRPRAAAELLSAEGIECRVVDMRWVKPLDEEAIAIAAACRLVVTVEEGVIAGGAGEGVLEVLARQGATTPAVTLGIPDRFIGQGPVSQLFADLGLNAEGIAATVREALG